MRFRFELNGSKDTELAFLDKVQSFVHNYPGSALDTLFSEDFIIWVQESIKDGSNLNITQLLNSYNGEISKLLNRIALSRSALGNYEKAVKGLESSLKQSMQASKVLHKRYEKDVTSLNVQNAEATTKIRDLEKKVKVLKIQIYDLTEKIKDVD